MSKIKAYNQLDIVLRFISISPFEKGGVEFEDILKNVINEVADGHELIKILNHLTKDGYLHHEVRLVNRCKTPLVFNQSPTSVKFYYSTIEGRLFNESGGYTTYINNQEKLKKLKQEQITSVIATNESVKSTNKIQKWSIFITGIVIILGAIFQLVNYFVAKENLEVYKKELLIQQQAHKTESINRVYLEDRIDSIHRVLEYMKNSKKIK